MNKSEIKREDLKSNFLRQTIIRLDYDILFDENIKIYTEKMYPYLIEKGYKMISNTMSNFELNINMDDSNNTVSNQLNRNDEKYTSFKNKEGNIIIDITKQYTTITVEYLKYEKFDEFSEIFKQIAGELKDIRIGFSFNRIGLRKINVIFFKGLDKINNYLETMIFNYSKQINDNKTKLLIKNSVETFRVDEYKVNRNTSVSNGIFTDENKKEQEAYQVMLDIDIYDDEMKENILNIDKMNNVLFEIYKDSLKDEFLNKMRSENFEDKEILKI